MKLIKKILILLLLIFVVAQFFGPEKNLGQLSSVDAFYADTNPPVEVKAIIQQTCFDCHTTITSYPWYSGITPVNYWMADHVKHGKKHFNVSAWSDYSIKKKDHKFEELIEMVEHKEMPLPSYTWTHSEASLTDEQIKSVVEWAERVRFKYSLVEEPQ